MNSSIQLKLKDRQTLLQHYRKSSEGRPKPQRTVRQEYLLVDT